MAPSSSGQVPGRVQAAHRSGERLDRGVEVAGRPRRQAEEPGPGAAGEVVVGAGQVRGHAARCADRTVDVPAGLGDCGAVNRDHGRAAAAAPSSAAPPAAVGRRRGRARGPPRRRRSRASASSMSPSASRLHAAMTLSIGRRRTTSSGSAPSQRRRVRSWLPAGLGQGELDEVRGVLDVVAGDRVAIRASASSRVSAYHRPAAGAGPAPGRAARRQTSPQRVGEEVVVAVPPPLVVERERRTGCRARGPSSMPLTVGPAGQGVAQRRRSAGRGPRCRAGTPAPARAGCSGPPRRGSRGRSGGCR